MAPTEPEPPVDPDAVVHEPDEAFAEATNVRRFMREYGIDTYDELVERTTTDLPGVEASGVDWFWDELVDYLDLEFYEPYDEVRDDSRGPQFADWYPGGRLNVAHNTLDRHAAVDAAARNRVAVLWEGEPGDRREVTFHDLQREANRVANYLDAAGVETGDTVGLYMPMVPEVVSVLYGCFKVGAVAVPIFSGFGTDAVATRLADAEPSVVFTGDGFYRRGSEVRLKGTLDAAIERAGGVERVVVHERLGCDPPWGARDEWWVDAVGTRSPVYETKSLPSDAESMLLYSSGTTGRPKGIVHTHAGVLTQCSKEVHFGFDQKPSDRFFWVSDIGWMMGPWTLVGNHAFGGTVVIYEGAPDHPGPDRLWDLIERHGVTTFGVSPTAVRALRKHGTEPVESHDLSSLRLLGSTGEPWDPESWLWFYEHVGGGDCPIINISGGTEICGCFLMPMPDQPLKPCTLGGPGLGMDVDIVNEAGESVAEAGERGYLVARDSCPSMTKSLREGDERYLEEYWSRFTDPPLWNHGDWAQRDDDGFWFLHGRADDTLNVAGRKVGPAEIEAVLVDHDAVTQAAAVGVPDATTGTAVVAYVVLEPGVEPSDGLRAELRDRVGEAHGKPFRPREVLFVDEFPLTQSGKVVRRAMAAAYAGEDPGDLSSVENPEALDRIREGTDGAR
ncbi:AMP-binding protein [Candidatus Halobonum tyrrellensis]|uniref:acetate--CoA ligase n=1 Tax=Candidatus Halobonum tyrrellensis G22 TaxID=1324957 RepID=V4GUA8_9EURY|nr:AMP-binding protein [Candidatus Halobonum tyrrellensis]ESP88716.1 AMP-dependent synthetase and ligase [Candidatus Halobonum tyrrellensis G22]